MGTRINEFKERLSELKQEFNKNTAPFRTWLKTKTEDGLLTKGLILLLVATNAISAFMVVSLQVYINDRIVYDMDRVREQHSDDIKYFYYRGCIDGTDYPNEWRLAPNGGFNEHSPSMYCNNNRTQLAELMENSCKGIGRK